MTSRTDDAQPKRQPLLPPGPLTVSRVPLPLAARDRIAWRIAALALCLFHCRSHTASIAQLQILFWSLRDPRNANALLSHWRGERGFELDSSASADPALLDTLRLAEAAQLIELQGSGKYKLADAGERFAEALSASDPITLDQEQAFLREISPITEAGMERHLGVTLH
ncbi:hypothetical protein MMUR_28340 [Mycolicibacterium murale]|uniref:Uncharacterized protein n=1 Tax=Mycolicibacterium murale TaxID=182220 RepID=A0A7I9WMX8_9MYCO|nr:hypothetical protein [Mycolicibacterium murale]MCV7182558.1 hypothetical protein [Mycolicibacterium murale]GFG58698.1 hypothetical protein MMUR_28340 [Mycolicibacterium murale]